MHKLQPLQQFSIFVTLQPAPTAFCLKIYETKTHSSRNCDALPYERTKRDDARNFMDAQ